MALKDLLREDTSGKKLGLSEERINAVLPVIREYAAFWREYPDMFVDFLVDGGHPENRTGESFSFLYYQRVFLRVAMRYKYTYMVFPRA